MKSRFLEPDDLTKIDRREHKIVSNKHKRTIRDSGGETNDPYFVNLFP